MRGQGDQWGRLGYPILWVFSLPRIPLKGMRAPGIDVDTNASISEDLEHQVDMDFNLVP